jgi:Mrp family chromosome partitioning ATPase
MHDAPSGESPTARMSGAARRLKEAVRNNKPPRGPCTARAAALPQDQPAREAFSPPGDARLSRIASAAPTPAEGRTSVPEVPPELERLMRRQTAFDRPPAAGPSLEIRLPAAHDPKRTPALNGSSLEFGPEMEELFDRVWVKVQRRLSRSSGAIDEEPSDEEIRHHNIQSIVATSWSLDEGCSTAALGLAARSASSAQGRVCLVDADFHSAGLSHAAGLENDRGLAELLAQEVELDDVLTEGPAPNLWFLPAGLARGPESLAVDARLQGVIQALEERFRYVFYDASCLKRGVEAYRWGRFVVNTILIVRAGRTRRETILHAVESMHLHGMKLLGAVLNHRVDLIPNWAYPYV